MNSALVALDIKTALSSGSLSAIVDYFQQAGALDALLIGFFGSAAWFVNKYYSFLYWWHNKDTETIEYLVAVKTEIKLNTTSFTRNFTAESCEQAKKNAKAMASARKRESMITGEAGENSVFDSIKSKLTVLPTDIIEPVVAYYSLEAEFSASYSSLSNPVLTKRHVDITLELIDTTHNDAQACIKQGKNTLKTIEQKIGYLKDRRTRRVITNLLCAGLVFAFLAGHITW